MSDNWRIGEEAAYGSDLIIRDVTDTLNGVDSRMRIYAQSYEDIGVPAITA